MSNIDHVLEIAESHAGEHEEGGNNCGPFVEKCLRSVHIGAGEPWCAAFVHEVFEEAGVRGWLQGTEAGDTWALQDWARAHHCYYQVPKRGDVMELLDASGQPMHTGFVTGVNADGTFSSIEGNTKATGVYDGPDGVHRRVRDISSSKFIRWAQALDVDAQPEDVPAK